MPAAPVTLPLRATAAVAFSAPCTPRARELMALFGITPQRIGRRSRTVDLRLNLRPGDIVTITGASGAGKTTLLNAFYDAAPAHTRLRLHEMPLPPAATLLDCIDGPVLRTLEVFCRAGLSDVFCLLQRPDRLSTGQRFRLKLAQALAAEAQVVFIDDFGADLDRITAGVLAHRLRRAAADSGRIFIIGSCHEEVLAELLPDVLIRIYSMSDIRVLFRDPDRQQTDADLSPGAA